MLRFNIGPLTWYILIPLAGIDSSAYLQLDTKQRQQCLLCYQDGRFIQLSSLRVIVLTAPANDVVTIHQREPIALASRDFVARQCTLPFQGLDLPKSPFVHIHHIHPFLAPTLRQHISPRRQSSHGHRPRSIGLEGTPIYSELDPPEQETIVVANMKVGTLEKVGLPGSILEEAGNGQSSSVKVSAALMTASALREYMQSDVSCTDHPPSKAVFILGHIK
ncbi:unnamed protein product [Protopolystoma xenopodis]|uniref:Uncharacterized protein n=1 Tax=Protopolystoma xenopodis TaxID=117903 RepID=A0A3S5BTQ8_9PLAT|nr:unnamed protein product [Protopolystoma xenopodis]